jgi:uncharacterized protein
VSQPEALIESLGYLKTYPVMDWNPEFCGTIDIVIRADGSWWHEGRPMARQSMIDLFSQLLKREGDDYFLVTPVEKLKITVEDLPLQIVDVDQAEANFTITTQQGEVCRVGEGHELAFDGDAENPLPRVHIRHGLWARFNRPAYYRLMELAEMQATDNGVRFILAKHRFDLAAAKA